MSDEGEDGDGFGAEVLVPVSLRGYKQSWLVTDLVAGATLAAVAVRTAHRRVGRNRRSSRWRGRRRRSTGRLPTDRAAPGNHQSDPGLIIFRYDFDLFYAQAVSVATVIASRARK